MIYFDNSATTVVSDEVLDTYVKVSKEFIGNANSIHKLGLKSKKLMNEAVKQVADILGVKEKEVIFTSSASESNNLAIKGVLGAYPKRKKVIITTELEHASISVTLQHFKEDVVIKYVNLDEDGHIDLKHLESLLDEGAMLVSIHHVNSELGVIQDIKAISQLVKKYNMTILHVDGTQSVGKIEVDLTDVDLFSFSAHKFFGPKGIACLIKKENINLTPLIDGGASQTIYRASTPAVALMASLAKALRLITLEQDKNYQKVKKLNQLVRDNLADISLVTINSPLDSSPYILNFSIKGKKPETVVHKFEEFDIYLSTKTACSSKEDYSKAVYFLTKNKEQSETSLRVSFSCHNTKEEVEEFIKILKEEIL